MNPQDQLRKPMNTYVERALFVVAPRNFGKSTTLRSLFVDHRFGTAGEIPTAPNLPDDYRLSSERNLYLRLTSPHEANESLNEFLAKTKAKMAGGRWCFAGPLHPDAYKRMPDSVATVAAFVQAFGPERVRVALLHPNYRDGALSEFFSDGARDLISDLHLIDDRVEVLCIDARVRGRNGRLLADFFDFS